MQFCAFKVLIVQGSKQSIEPFGIMPSNFN